MPVINRATAQTQATTIRDETVANANTATRVGGHALDIADSVLFPGEASIVNADISAAAAIAYSKLNLTGAILNADLAGSIAYSKLTLTGSIVNADISASAAIAKSKLAALAIVDADVDAAAAIEGSKINPDFAAQNVTTTGVVNIGATPATAGDIRLKNAFTLQARNAANSANVQLLTLDGSNNTLLGSSTSGIQFTSTGNDIRFTAASAERFRVETTRNLAFTAGYAWLSTVVAPTLSQLDDATNGVTGDTLLVQAQNATGTTSTGGALDLRSGTGTTAAGEISLAVGATKRVRANATGLGFFGVAPVARPAAYTPTNVTADRAFDADTVAVAELADVVGTLIADLQSLGLLQ